MSEAKAIDTAIRPLDERSIFDAIREGISDGIFRIATHPRGTMPCAEFHACIQAGVKDAIETVVGGVRLVHHRWAGLDVPQAMKLESAAVEALAALFAHLIRQNDNPDHRGPENAAEKLAEAVVNDGKMQLADWGSWL